MNTPLRHHLLECQVGAVEHWLKEHHEAMVAWDTDDAIDTLARVWRIACVEADRQEEPERERFRAWLEATRLLDRLGGLLDQIAELAERVNYFDRGLRFSRERLAGFRRGVELARQRGNLPRRVQLDLDLDALPPVLRTND